MKQETINKLPSIDFAVANRMTKRALARHLEAAGLLDCRNIDYALPQPWLDAAAQNANMTYNDILATTVMHYPNGCGWGEVFPMTRETADALLKINAIGIDQEHTQ